MKQFKAKEVRSALEHAAQGGQALHIFNEDGSMCSAFPKAPAVFKRSYPWAHLFDQNLERLQETARRLGVKVIKVDRQGTMRQHIDLVAGPLERAMKECL